MIKREFRERLSSILTDCDLLKSKSQRNKLQELGFGIERRGKHLMLHYHGKRNYQIAVSCTTSDRRMGKNLVTKIMRTLSDEFSNEEN